MTIVTVAPVDDKNISQMEKKTLNYIRLVPIRKSQLFVLICGRRKTDNYLEIFIKGIIFNAFVETK